MYKAIFININHRWIIYPSGKTKRKKFWATSEQIETRPCKLSSQVPVASVSQFAHNINCFAARENEKLSSWGFLVFLQNTVTNRFFFKRIKIQRSLPLAERPEYSGEMIMSGRKRIQLSQALYVILLWVWVCAGPLPPERPSVFASTSPILV